MAKRNIIIVVFLVLELSATTQHVNTAYYTAIFPFQGGYAEVEQSGKYGFINTKGEPVVPCIYDEVYGLDFTLPFYHGVATVRKGYYWGAVDTLGKIRVQFIYDILLGFWDNGTGIASKKSKMGCINYKGDTIVSFKYDNIWFSSEGIREVRLNGKVGYLDSTGRQVIACKYDSGASCSERVFGVRKGDKWGFVNANDTIIVPFKYDSVSLFSEGLAAVSLNGKTGFIDKKNNTILPLIYDVGDYTFIGGYARVRKNGKTGMIDKKGRVVIPFVYEDYGNDEYKGNCFIIDRKLDGEAQLYALYDTSGKQITGFDYNLIYYLSADKYVIKKNDKYGVIDGKGKLLVQPEYEDFFWNSSCGIIVTKKHNMLVYIDSTVRTLFSFADECDKNDMYFNSGPLNYLFLDTVAVVSFHGSWRIINRKGQFMDNFSGNAKVKFYNEDGGLRTCGKLKNFYKEGTWKEYYENGKPKVKVNYVHGKIKGMVKEYYQNGNLERSTIYKSQDDLMGTSKEYDINGKEIKY